MLASTEPHEQHTVQRRAFMLTFAASGLVAARAARAQAYPMRPVRIIVGSAAGATPDVFIRILAQRFT
jgi:tripartite-type tricarboxylate transporter receptor subunit TctC